MSFDHLKLFKDIAQARSVSRGAAMNSVSQSAASQHVRELERSMSVTLLDRTSRPLLVTEAGRLYLEFCRDVLRRREEFEAGVDRLKSETEGTVRVAAIYSVGLSEMSQLEREFLRRYPKAKLEVEYLRPDRVWDAVLTGTAELGLMSYAEATRELEALPWRQEEMVLAVYPGHPLARYKAVAPQELEGQEFIGFDEDLPISRHVGRYLKDQDVRVKMALHFDNLQMIKEAVAQNAGVSIMPARVMQAEVVRGRLVPVRLVEPRLYRPLYIVLRRKRRFARAAQAFLDLLEEKPGGAAEAAS